MIRICLQNIAFLKDTLIIVFELNHCKFLMTNRSKEDISCVLEYTNQRLLSSLMGGNCPLLENVLFPTHLAEQLGFWRQTMLLPQRKRQKQPSCSAKGVFTQTRLKQRAAISNHSSFAIVIPGKLF